ncbi:MAG: hypothetical protein ACTHJJ_15910 [Intrasporangium sp.]|uniref:hypothetical protein n=1 Tax=Intrasporangium sp. TaxID=1925024 RepID=UPI003F7E44B4
MRSCAVIGEAELAKQTATLLPSRDTLCSFGCVNVTVAPVVGVNLAFAINAATINSHATALASQYLSVLVP